MKKILFIVDDERIGGVSSSLINLFSFIDYKNIKIDLLYFHKVDNAFNNISKDIKIINLPYFDIADYSLKILIKNKDIKRIFKKLYFIFLMKTGLIKYKIKKYRNKHHLNDYDIEVSYKDGFSTIFTMYSEVEMKILWLHSDYDRFNPYKNYMRIVDKNISNIDKFVAVSENVSNNFNKIYHQDQKTIIIHNIIDQKSLLKKANEETINYDKSKINIVTIARFHSLKGNYRLIKIIKKIVDTSNNKDFVFTMIGDGDEFLTSKDYVSKNNLGSYIHLMGSKSNPYPYLKEADLYVLPSYSESFGIVLVESLLLNVPVLTTNVTSVNQIVDPKNGMIVNNTDDDIYNGLMTLINNKNKILEYKNNLNNYHYDILSEIDKINSLLK